jgi:hypothetical protein
MPQPPTEPNRTFEPTEHKPTYLSSVYPFLQRYKVSMASVFPEEDLSATAEDGQGYFITRPGFGLKAGRYTINRKIGKGSYSSTYLVFDEDEK